MTQTTKGRNINMMKGKQMNRGGNRHWMGARSRRLAAALKGFGTLAGIALLVGLVASGLMPAAERVVAVAAAWPAATAAEFSVGRRVSARTAQVLGSAMGGLWLVAAIGLWWGFASASGIAALGAGLWVALSFVVDPAYGMAD